MSQEGGAWERHGGSEALEERHCGREALWKEDSEQHDHRVTVVQERHT